MRVIQMDPFSGARPRQSFTPHQPPAVPSAPKINIASFKKDDWILLGIIATLIFEGSTDYILLCALGYLFIVGL